MNLFREICLKTGLAKCDFMIAALVSILFDRWNSTIFETMTTQKWVIYTLI